MSVIEFPRKDEVESWLSGRAMCLACKHEWVSVAVAGTSVLDCPACGLPKGVLRAVCSPDGGGMLWTCNCGCTLFYFTTEGARCAVCALLQRFPKDMS